MRKLAEFTLIALLAFPPLASADPVPASRRTDWTYTGVPGGIPNRTTICATFSPGATAAAINNAITSCNNGVILLNAGTYTSASLGGAIQLYKSNVTLRGAGANQTTLTGLDIINLGNGFNVSLGTAITGGASKGSTTFTVASTANLTVGTMIEIDRADDTNLVVNTGTQGGGTRNLTQVNKITAVNGSTITVRNPFIYDFSVGSPQVKFYFGGVTQKSGVENLKLEHAGFSGGHNFINQYCDSCWFKGIESAHATGYHFFIGGSLNLEIRDSYIHEGASGPNNSGPNFYGDYRYGANSSVKIENNIFNKDAPAIELNGSSSGFYIGYNYSYGSPSQFGTNLVTWTFDDGHAPFDIMNLYEGNIGEMWGADNYFGGTGYGTALRNYFTGYNPNYGVYSEAVWLDRLAYDYNIVGNVLGSTLQGPIAYTGCTLYTTAHPGVYRLGYPNLGNCGTSPDTPDNFTPPGGYPDPKVAATLLRWGNYDYFNRATRFVASEIPTGVPVPPDQVIPNSYYYSSRPAWWNAGIAWPPIGPDVTGGNGDTSGHVNKIPAQVCWETSNLLGGGSFNASACFAATTSPAITSALSATGTVGTPFSYTITATNNPTSFNATGLPAGLSVNTPTGVISGTPTVAGTSSVALNATNTAGTGSATLALTINAFASPAITGVLTASSTVGTPFSYTITATNNPTSFNATGLPAGLSVSPATGVISGTSTAAETSTVTLSATNATGTGSATLTLRVDVAASPPAISSALTASGTGGSPFSYTITATNNPTSRNATGLPAGLSVNTATGVISGTPTAAGTSSIALSATNATGTGSATLALTINEPAPEADSSLFLASDVPAVVNVNDTRSVELGVKFTASTAGSITGFRFYKGSQDTGTHTAHLWSATGTLLTSATFSGETASGWQQVNLTTPVAIAANTTYIASYHSNGFYSADGNYFATAHTNGPLTAPASASSRGNGVYAYGSAVSFPSNTFNTTNYWVDVVFSGTTTTSPPAISSALSASGTAGTPFGYTITAANNPTSFNATGLPAGLSVSPATGGISGTPTEAGTSTVALSATNATGTGSATLTLTIDAAGISTLFSGTVSSIVVYNDPNPVELGVKFYPSRNGQITGIMFYKNPQDTGTHTAHLWSSSGTLLASATFAGETASGWQAVQFANPVAITANTIYIASYHTTGFYSATRNYFATAHGNGPLTAPASASSGGNGVYAYGSGVSFPSNTYIANNYWVDVVFR